MNSEWQNCHDCWKTNTVSSRRSGYEKISCDMRGTYFPFDVQHCYWSYLSFPLHSTDVLLLNAKIDHENIINYAQEFQFEIQPFPKHFFFNENSSDEISQLLSGATPKWISLAKNSCLFYISSIWNLTLLFAYMFSFWFIFHLLMFRLEKIDWKRAFFIT